MTGKFDFFLSGQVLIKFDGVPIENLASIKAKALLIYLAVTGKSHSRSALAALLWSDMPESTARANLRVALSTLRKSIGGNLDTNRQSVQMINPEKKWVDVLVFEKVCAQSNLGTEPIEKLREFSKLYQGDFLEDFYVSEAPLFEEWATLMRERFRQTAVDCLDFLVTQATEQDAISDGIIDARRLLALDPWREKSHRQLMILLAHSGQRSAALAQYENCSKIMAQELGVEPSLETRQVYEKIRDGIITESSKQVEKGPSPKTSQPQIRNNLPLQTKPFVGREDEISHVIRQLNSSGVNLVTLTGLGGIGKTRLAIQIGFQLLNHDRTIFEHGIFYVPLIEISSPDLIVSKICEVLSLPTSSNQHQHQQLLEYLREKHLLLILDNFEHILEASNFLIEFLENAPKIKLLVTSRAALNLDWEWVFPLSGLAYPKDTRTQSSQEDQRLPEEYPAIHLFIRCAQRAYPGFQYLAEMKEIIRICQLIDGMPLGIELAAAWTRVIPCAEIAEEIDTQINTSGKDFLSTDLEIVPDHQRSLAGVFEYSWQLLPDKVRLALSKLSVFQSGFSRNAAETVADASLRDLAMLTDKSLIQRLPNGRYLIHELLRQFANHKLADIDLSSTKKAHSHYYGGYLRERADQIEEPQTSQVLIEVQTEFANINAGWNYLLDQIPKNQPNTIDSIKSYIPTLAFIFLGKSYYQDGARVFTLAERIMVAHGWENQSGQPCTEKTQILARIRSYLAAFCFYLGQFSDGRDLLKASISVLDSTKNTAEIAIAHLWLGMIEIRTGAYQNADEHLQKSLGLFHELEKPIQISNTLNALGVSAHHQGELKEAETYYRQSLAISRRNEHFRGQANGINNLGSLYAYLGDHEKAVQQYQETLELAKNQDDPLAIAMALSNLGSSNRGLGHYQKSLTYYKESLSRFQELGDKRWIAVVMSGLGQTFLELNQFNKAREYIQKGLIIADQIQSLPDILDILYALACWLIARKQLQQAAVILHFVMAQPASRELQKKRCKNQLDIISRSLSRQTMHQAKTAATELKLDKMVSEALAVN